MHCIIHRQNLGIFEELNVLNKELQGTKYDFLIQRPTFSDLKDINYPSWMTQPLRVDMSDVTMEYQGERSELQNDDSIKALLKIKGIMMWFCEETLTKYQNTCSLARNLLLPFPSSNLVECGFSAVNEYSSDKISLQWTSCSRVSLIDCN